MILSRSNLQVVEMTRTDKDIPALDSVHIRSDGSTVGTNGLAVVCVSPVADDMRKHAIIEDSNVNSNDVTVTGESIKEVLKNLPRDTKYSGVLELCSLIKEKFKLYDGKRTKSIGAKMYKREYVQYQEVLEKAWNDATEIEMAINLRRMFAVLKCIDDITVDSTKEIPVFIRFTKNGNIIFRATNRKNQQQVIAVMKAYEGVEGKVPALSTWEKKLFGIVDIVKRKVRKVKSLRSINLTLKKRKNKAKDLEGIKKLKQKIRRRSLD